jgi:hypothetical protein
LQELRLQELRLRELRLQEVRETRSGIAIAMAIAVIVAGS